LREKSRRQLTHPHTSFMYVGGSFIRTYVQDIALAGPVASITVVSIMKLNMTCVSLSFAIKRWLYFSGFFIAAAMAALV
jgi:hypothetical protein